MKISVIGIDLAKNSFHVHAVDSRNRKQVSRAFTRAKLRQWLQSIEPCVVGMEACAGAHHFARLLSELGFCVRLISPLYVKPYVKRNKNDAADAAAICQAIQNPEMTFVQPKTVDQQEMQMLHRVRSRQIRSRTALVAQARGFLLEAGVPVATGIAVIRKKLPEILEQPDLEFGPNGQLMLAELYEELVQLDARIARLDKRVQAFAKADDACRRLMTIPGVGPITATALVCAIGDPRQFYNGRHLSAWLGLVPRQHSTGGKPTLRGISKRGDSYLRTLLIHGARSALRVAPRREDRRSQWALRLVDKRGRNKATVALANKMARSAWVLLTEQTTYDTNKV